MASAVNTFNKIAIANRGEIAVRIIRACHEMGIKTVLLHSEADMNSMAYRLADDTVCIGPAPVMESYLNIGRNIQGAISAGCDAIHPGVGFLSESAEFAEACERSSIVFIGPHPNTIKALADKSRARHIMSEAGIPVIDGYDGFLQDEKTLQKHAEQIGYPLLIKARSGGGGRGLRVVSKSQDFISQLQTAKRECRSFFGSDTVILEKYLTDAKHIEVQVFGDSHGQVFHLGERECTIQRRHQKIIEEGPSPSIDEITRRRMTDAALLVASKTNYQSAGTVEFLLRGKDFYFLEMNPRLQVEHPVTEMLYGVDLVKAQIRTAQGEKLSWRQDSLVPRGHAFECRIYAENSYKNGVPSRGVLGTIMWPYGSGRRFETGFEKGDDISAYYDTLLAKVLVWDENRLSALQKTKYVLSNTIIFGVHTNIAFLQRILEHPFVRTGKMTTLFLQREFPRGLIEDETLEEELLFAQKVFDQVPSSGTNQRRHKKDGPISPWLHGWNAVGSDEIGVEDENS
jgi:acetyl/propionyl-CoA carboxylase alpha subunit